MQYVQFLWAYAKSNARYFKWQEDGYINESETMEKMFLCVTVIFYISLKYI